MGFTNDDLKRLKEHYPCGMCPDNDKYIPALIARLEAAEELVSEKIHPVHPFPSSTGDNCPIAKAEAKWRLACGKQEQG